MSEEFLSPRLELLSQDYLLVQAWKKTASYIRYHNWYSDTLELDRTAVNLPRFLDELAQQLKTPDQWINDPLRIVPAPKSQQWRVNAKSNQWEPVERGMTAVKLRPLAHVTIRDQVAATAVMLCLADRVETLQGDPRSPIKDTAARKQVISYGNRLFCDESGGQLHHRWGSGRLYRAYFQDYQTFLDRPEIAAKTATVLGGTRIVIVHSDLRQFYDRVRPSLVNLRMDTLEGPNDDPGFFDFVKRLLCWVWHTKDESEVLGYASKTELNDFSRVALPQGLVSAGFFANVALLDFDQGLKEAVNHQIRPGVTLMDVCRYVDDLRMVLAVNYDCDLAELEQISAIWIQELLDVRAQGLIVSKEKTKAVTFTGEERLIVRQSRKMRRIQGAISGGFDAVGGQDILYSIQGLIRSQRRYTKARTDENGWAFSPIPDVEDATVARFAAARFRSTFRSLRPLLEECTESKYQREGDADACRADAFRLPRTQEELDDEMRAFALGLIETWVGDPSNVRLLRIGLDLWPAEEVLEGVLELLRPYTEKGGRRKAPRRVAWYCLSEIFRAAATETGFVNDQESLPKGIDLDAYRSVLLREANRLVSLPPATLPWYLKQQLLLFLAVNSPKKAPILRTGRNAETRHYRELIRFLRGESGRMKNMDFATLAVLSRRSFLAKAAAVEMVEKDTTPDRLEQIAQRDPSFAMEILELRPGLSQALSPQLRDDLCIKPGVKYDNWVQLSELVLENGSVNGPLRNELSLLSFASSFFEAFTESNEILAATPSQVLIRKLEKDVRISKVEKIKLIRSRVAPEGSMYFPPAWCPNSERWRFQLGYLMRFILVAQRDFTKVVRPVHLKEGTSTYRPLGSHWYQRLYGLFNRQCAFGDDWLPISDWTEQFLFALLHWPGCRPSEMIDWVHRGMEKTRELIDNRYRELLRMRGQSSGVIMLPQSAPRLDENTHSRPLRVCVVQTVIPTDKDFTASDLTLSDRNIRRRHRDHLSKALAAVRRMLILRETHKGLDGRLDWLILPELSVHPRDILTHLVPFARAYRAIILVGLTYQELSPAQPLVNSALWVIPAWSDNQGLQIVIRRQGKCHLAPDEEALNSSGRVIQGFRPCQWLIGYEWCRSNQERPLWLTASICYDATDLSLVADLRHHSDVFAIPALNRDVNTFDNMALALHYHMFQMVIVANNGRYGGSNAYAPYRETYSRQVFHLHGQPQASMAFLEIEDISGFLRRKNDAKAHPPGEGTTSSGWKSPPAGI